MNQTITDPKPLEILRDKLRNLDPLTDLEYLIISQAETKPELAKRAAIELQNLREKAGE